MAFSNAQQIAARLCDPQTKHHLVVVGDSTLTAKQPYVLTHMSSVAWSGTNYGLNASQAANGAHAAAAGAATPNQAATSPYIGSRQYWYFGGGGIEARFSGAVEPADNALVQRIANPQGNARLTNWPLLAPALPGKTVRVKHVYYRHAGGMAGNPGFRVVWLHELSINITDPNCYAGTYATDVTGSGYGVCEVVLPTTHPWETVVSIGANVAARPGGTTVNLQTLSIATPTVECDGPGIVYHTVAGGGWTLGGWLDNTEVPPALFTEFLPMFAPSPIFWIDLGTNGTVGITTAEQHAAGITSLIAKCRAAYPEADILLTTAHEHSTSGPNPIHRAGAHIVRDTVPGVLLLDTMAALPPFVQGSQLGYYSDAVHYNATGDTNKFTVINNMIAAAAVTGLPLSAGTPTITSPTLTQLTQLTGLSITAGVPTITAGTLSLQPPPLRIVNLTYKWRATQSAGTSTSNPPTFLAYRGHALDMGMFTIAAPTGFSFQGTVARLRIGRPGEAAHVEWRSDDVPSGVLFGWNDATGELSIDMPSSAVDVQEAGRYTYQITIISTSDEPLGPPCVGYFRVASTVGAMLN